MPPDANHELPWLKEPALFSGEELDELAATVRVRRDELIAETDYLMMPDYPIQPEQRDSWEIYRQSLRDITRQKGFPKEILWPEKPL